MCCVSSNGQKCFCIYMHSNHERKADCIWHNIVYDLENRCCIWLIDSFKVWEMSKLSCMMNQSCRHDDKQVFLYLSHSLLRVSSSTSGSRSLSAKPVFEWGCLCHEHSPRLIWLCVSGWLYWSSVWKKWVKDSDVAIMKW